LSKRKGGLYVPPQREIEEKKKRDEESFRTRSSTQRKKGEGRGYPADKGLLRREDAGEMLGGERQNKEKKERRESSPRDTSKKKKKSVRGEDI